jgi:hypothetical protein
MPDYNPPSYGLLREWGQLPSCVKSFLLCFYFGWQPVAQDHSFPLLAFFPQKPRGFLQQWVFNEDSVFSLMIIFS